MTPLSEQQRLFLVESTQIYAPWVQARQHLASYKYGMKWVTSKEREYLYRVHDAVGNAKSLGPRSPETESVYQSFIDGRLRAKERASGLDDRMKIQARLNKAVNLGRLPMVVSEILQAVDLSKAREDFRIVCAHAIYAYESMAGVHLKMELLASGDVDLLYDPRKKLSLVAKNLNGNGLLGLLRKVDSTFEVVEHEAFRAVNKTGFMVDLIMPTRDMRHPEKVAFAVGDLAAVEVPNLQWLGAVGAGCV
ncbi:GSU2403 family nucleotidyltransferase fold protein [Propionivibrio sp.]|uniref:GSU2403 family nucleotidyltransferase fold protein n=1 Tax=Propionivibrio sp. TaxID=2212460 RepID=UPI003BF42C6C